jgi:hypothetical protein
VQSGLIQTRPPLPVFGAATAPPGAVQFHRFLEDLNRTRPAADRHAAPAPCPIRREPDRYGPCPSPAPAAASGHPAPALLPRLGEVLPVAPAAAREAVTQVQRTQRSTTGRLIDLLA